MSKFKLFIENMLVYGLGGIISKIIPLIMVPIVTRLMPDTAYFGLSDLANTLVSFASALAIMGMYDAMYRLFFDKDEEEYKKSICSTALLFTLCVSVLVFLILLLFRKPISAFFFGDPQYAYLVFVAAIATLVGATNSIVSAPTRMQNKKGIYLVANIISPVLSYSLSIPLLLRGHYIFALPLSALISGLTMEIFFAILNKKWFHMKLVNFKLLKPLLNIALPTLPTFLIYWIFNSSDKLMIANILGVSAEGIYSVGAKLGMASQLIYLAFSGGWQYFAFATMREKNQVESNSKIFEYLGAISFVATAFICAWSYIIHKLLYVGDYISGYVVSPYLFLAPLLQMLFQVAANQFLVIKKAWPIAVVLTGGALLNVLLNFFLITTLGIEGAAIATLCGYAVAVVVCLCILCKMKLMVVSKRFLCAVLITALYMVVWRLFFRERTLISTVFAVIIAVIFAFLYRKDLKVLIQACKKKGKKGQESEMPQMENEKPQIENIQE